MPLFYAWIILSCSTSGEISSSQLPNISLEQAEEEPIKNSILLAPDVTEEMLKSDYWLKSVKNPQKVLMTLKDINLWNKANVVSQNASSDISLVEDLRNCSLKMTGEEIRKSIAMYNPSVPWYKKVKTKKGETIRTLNDKDWKVFWQEMNLEMLAPYREWINQKWIAMKPNKKEFAVKRAVTIRRSNLRVIPEDNFYSDDKEFWYDDIAQNSGVLMNEPLIVMWHSSDKKWLYVKTSYCTGWIHAQDVAYCTQKQWLRYFDWELQNQNEIILITQDKLQLSNDYFTKINNVYRNTPEFSMGTTLHLAQWTSENVKKFDTRIPYASYLVEIPFKKTDDTLGILYAAIPAFACNRGLLPYTTQNVLNLSFQSLGIRYGWGGMANARDCSEYLKDIFKCFGFNLPRNSRSQMMMAGKSFDVNNVSIEEKKKILDSIEPGAILGFPGHVFLYLGNINGKHYTISALGSYYPDDKMIEEKIDVCSVNINTLDVARKNGKTWLECLTNVKLLSNEGTFYEPYISFDKNWKYADYSKINSGKSVLYKATLNRKNITVAINAGHGTQGGSKYKTFSHPDKSPKITDGTSPKGAIESIAISDGMTFKDSSRESDVNLKVSTIIRSELLKKGFDVLMIRDSKDVQLDNIARTLIANNNADIHIAIHFDGDNQKSDKGIFYCSIPKELKEFDTVKKHYANSEKLGSLIIQAAQDEKLAIYKDGQMQVDLTQTSFSTIPTVDIELGNQHTPTELQTLKKRAAIVVRGVELYFAETNKNIKANKNASKTKQPN